MTLQEDPFECLSKFCVEDAIDNRIERGVGVAEPREHFKSRVSDASLAEGRDDVDAEERHPAN